MSLSDSSPVELLDGNTTDHFAVSNKNEFRLPDYHRLDLAINYHFDRIFGGKSSLGLSVFNVYGRKNVWYKEFEVVDNTILETDVNLLGFTPSLFGSLTIFAISEKSKLNIGINRLIINELQSSKQLHFRFLAKIVKEPNRITWRSA